MLFCGVDIGKKGAFSVIDENDNILWIADNMNYFNVVKKLDNLPNDNIIFMLEDVHATLKSSAKGTFNFGRSKGIAEGIVYSYLATRGISDVNIDYVLPQTWKKFYGLITNTHTLVDYKKELSVKKCYEIFPNANLYPSPRYIRPSDDRAESLLIAYYCKSKYDLI